MASTADVPIESPSPGLARQLSFIADLLPAQYGLDILSVERIETAFNNHVYRVEIFRHGSKLPIDDDAAVPGTWPVPADASQLVVRLPNLSVNVNHATRVENEVAGMVLLRDALESYGLSPRLIPEVYGWQNHSEGKQGYILEEWKEGVALRSVPGRPDILKTHEQRRDFMDQWARVLKAMQDYRLPDHIKGYGGLAFDRDGKVVTGPLTPPAGGPFESIPQMYQAMVQAHLEIADSNDLLRGWRRNGLRERIDRFVKEKFMEEAEKLKDGCRCIVHGDMDFSNLLYDEASQKMTAFLDFDFIHIGPAIEEFFFSFGDTLYILGGPYDSPDPEDNAHRERILQGFSTLVDEKERDGRFDRAHSWHQALERARALQPSTIAGSEDWERLFWFVQDLCPWYMLDDRWVKRNEGRLDEVKEEADQKLGEYLKFWEY